MMKIDCEVESADLQKTVHALLPKMRTIVQTHAERVAALARSLAPRKSGALRAGILPSPWEERSAKAYKIGRQVYMEHQMNDTFVKLRKDGKRYYYPASQEYGFRVRRGNGAGRKTAGRYFMRNAADLSSTGFYSDMEAVAEEVLTD